jgi:hypothetical protein
VASKRRQKRKDERLRRQRLERQCLDKVVYTSERDARLSARAVGKKKGEVLVHYLCPLCTKPGENRYHIGHPPEWEGFRFPSDRLGSG